MGVCRWCVVVVYGFFLLSLGGEGREIMPPPPLDVSWEEWQRKMPLPLRKDLEVYLAEGEGHIDWRLSCECAPEIPKDRFAYYYHEGAFWYPNQKDTTLKNKRDRAQLQSLGEHLKKKYGTLPTIKIYADLEAVAQYNMTCPCNPHFPPVFTLANTLKQKHFIRRPTVYLTEKWVHKEGSKLYAKKKKWEEKRNQACWRGNVGSKEGGKERLTAMLLQQALIENMPEKAEMFDLAVTRLVKTREATRAMTNTSLGRFPKKGQADPGIFSECKYNLHLPGHTTGGYSRALQNLISQDTMVLFWESSYREYYYDWMIDGVHYLKVKPQNLIQTVEWLRNHDEEARQLSENGLSIFENYLQAVDILTYWEWIILTYMRLSKKDIPPDLSKHCSCTPSTPLNICPSLQTGNRSAGKCKPHHDHSDDSSHIALLSLLKDKPPHHPSLHKIPHPPSSPCHSALGISSLDPLVNCVIQDLGGELREVREVMREGLVGRVEEWEGDR